MSKVQFAAGLTIVTCALVTYAQQTKPPTNPTKAPLKIESKRLPNAFRLNDKVISGGLPEGDAAFKELSELGVKTVISVDGAKPDVTTASKHGLRYVHMPHSYDGIPDTRAKELGKAIRDLPGTIYIHCHHGKHRSPAAAVVACVEVGLMAPADAVPTLKTAGTGENYRGLYQAAAQARRLSDKLLDELKVEYPETVEVAPMAEAMVAIEHTHDHLKKMSTRQWQPLDDHPDLDAEHEALLLKELFVELGRTEETKEQPEKFQQLLHDSESAASELESALKTAKSAKSPDFRKADEAFARVTKRCADCHRDYRDVPLGEK